MYQGHNKWKYRMHSTNEISETQKDMESYSATRESNNIIPELQQVIDNGFVRYKYKDNSAVVIDTFGKKIYELDYNNKLLKISDIESELDIKLFKSSLDVLNNNF